MLFKEEVVERKAFGGGGGGGKKERVLGRGEGNRRKDPKTASVSVLRAKGTSE
jgi:hypothetical protein